VGINSDSIIRLLGAIHCIVKEVGAYNPIHISHAPLDSQLYVTPSYPVLANITNNSGIQQATVYWTDDTTQSYNVLPMTNTTHDSFSAEIPQQTPGTEVFYYLEAISVSQKVRTRPVTAPGGLYHFAVTAPVSIADEPAETIQEITLYPGFPNPFNNSTTIKFYLPIQTEVSLAIYNSLGEKIITLHNGLLKTGFHSYQWNADLAGSGIYFYRLSANGFTETRKIILIK
jgi:hypothetical protein